MVSATFNYPVSREYPYRWFGWVTIVGGVLFTVLFSVFNVANSGYQLRTISTTDPNATVAERYWFDQLPSTTRLSAACQEKELQVGTDFFTDKLWNKYAILPVTDNPVFMYNNNEFQSCIVDPVRLVLTNTTNEPGLFLGPVYEISIFATANCVLNATPPTKVTLFSSWNLDQADQNLFDLDTEVAERLMRDQPSIYWADILLLGYYQRAWADITGSYGNKTRISYTFIRNPDVDDMNSTDFFHISKNNYSALSNVNENERRITPPLSIERLAKSFYAATLADLGQPNTTVLTDPTLLDDWTKDFPSQFELMSYVNVAQGAPTNYEKFKNVSGQLGTNASRIHMRYVCEVPQLKPASALISSVLVADLVYLQALWWIYTWAVTWWLRRTDSQAMHCKGCMVRSKEDDLLGECDN